MGNFPKDDGSAFDEELRRELRPRSAPQGLAERIMERAENSPRLAAINGNRREPRLFEMPILRWAVAAMLLVMVAAGGYMEHLRQERIAGEHARQQVLLALRITNSTLQAVHDKVVDDGHPHDQEESQ